MELPPFVFTVFEATVLASAALLAVMAIVDVLALPPAPAGRAYSQRILALCWTATPLLLLSALLTAIAGVSLGL